MVGSVTEAVTFVPNATTGVNTVLRNLVFTPGDVIIYLSTIYGACEKTVVYITETTAAEAYKIEYTYPISDAALCKAFEQAIVHIKAQGKIPKIAIYDTIVSLPGVRMPFEELTKICKKYGTMSLVDGAHAIGHIHLDLTALDPDFFVSNCHKWLFAPRGCALMYVPIKNQHLIRSTLPTSHGFAPFPKEGAVINNPLPPSSKSAYIANFEFVGTMDNGPFTSVPAAIEFRKACTWKGKSGEDAIIAFTQDQARQAGKVVAEILGTEVMENEEKTLGNCNLSNVRLPLEFDKIASGDHTQAVMVAQWIANTLVAEYDTFIAIIFYAGAWWVRLSSQVYLNMADWQWAGETLKEICDRAQKGEALN